MLHYNPHFAWQEILLTGSSRRRTTCSTIRFRSPINNRKDIRIQAMRRDVWETSSVEIYVSVRGVVLLCSRGDVLSQVGVDCLTLVERLGEVKRETARTWGTCQHWIPSIAGDAGTHLAFQACSGSMNWFPPTAVT